MKVLRIIFQLLLGAIFGVASTASLSPLLASLGPQAGAIGTFIVFGMIVLLVAMAPNVRRAFGSIRNSVYEA